ncbi:MAG: argininosuccinate lyase [Candidatus Methylomirabilales bacterium]
MRKKAWGGRFEGETARQVEAFTASIGFDWVLFPYDIQGSIAYAQALRAADLLAEEELLQIVVALEEIRRELSAEPVKFDPADEDIHMYIERRLIEKIGQVGGKLHTGRSRNDQVALDLRLYLRHEIRELLVRIAGLQGALIDQGEAHLEVILPGYTHLQRAQPVLLAHHLLAYVEMLGRDRARLEDCLNRVNVLPLGSGALAGSPYPIDRAYLAGLLEFPQVSANSIDAVSDRDFVVEFLAAAGLGMVHLSRLAEDLILWASAEFCFITLPDPVTTGSSMMPQKKNLDVAELARGKTGRVVGDLVALLTALKGLPLAYNRDLQEDKEPLFDAVNTWKSTLDVLTLLVPALSFNAARMREACQEGFLNATDAADYLVGQGLPFREAHEVIGRAVQLCLKSQKRLEQLSLGELRRLSPLFEKSFYDFIKLEACVNRRQVQGGTAPARVREALEVAKGRLLSRPVPKGESE